mmetsp:Transcript_25681/g.29530  ORF Transcript_25681/g.29530 Transcript_25681/m.29530 type:complete len:214 (-) Transcript_25681:43-684(-)
MEMLRQITIYASMPLVPQEEHEDEPAPVDVEAIARLKSPKEKTEELSGKDGMMTEIKEHSKVYYLHRNDVRYKKILRGCKKYYLDKFEEETKFNRKEKDSREKMNQIQTSCIEFSSSLGFYSKNPNYAIYLASFLFPREMNESLTKGYLDGIFTRCLTGQMRKKVNTISETIVKFSTNRLKDFLKIKEMAYLVNYYLSNGATEFFNDDFYSDI